MARLHNDDVRMGEESVESQLAAPVSQVTFSRITDDDDAMPSSGQTVVPVIPIYTDGTYTTATIDSWTDNGGQNVGTPGDINTNTDVSVTIPIEYVDIQESITYTDVVIVDDFTPATLQQLQNDGWTFYAVYTDFSDDEVDYTEVFDPSTVQTQEVVDQAYSVANAQNQHFWTDSNGIHVTEDEKEDWLDAVSLNFSDQSDTSEHHNVLINSLGTLFRRRLNNLVSIARNAISFYTGDGNTTADILAFFGTSGSQIGPSNKAHVNITPRLMSMTDINNNTLFQITNHAEDDGYIYKSSTPTPDIGFYDSEIGNLIYIYHTYVVPPVRQIKRNSEFVKVPWEFVSFTMKYGYVWNGREYAYSNSIDLLPYENELGFSSTDLMTTSTKYKANEITFDAVAFANFCYERGFIDTNTPEALYQYEYDTAYVNGIPRNHFPFKFELVVRDSQPRASLVMGNQYASAEGSYSIALGTGDAWGEESIAVDHGRAAEGSFAAGKGVTATNDSIAVGSASYAENVSDGLSDIRTKTGWPIVVRSLGSSATAQYGSILIGCGQDQAKIGSLAVGASNIDTAGHFSSYNTASYFSAAIGVGNAARYGALALGIFNAAEKGGLTLGEYSSGWYGGTEYSGDFPLCDSNAIKIGNGKARLSWNSNAVNSYSFSTSFVVKRNGGMINCNYIASVDPNNLDWGDNWTNNRITPVFFEVGNKSVWRYSYTTAVGTASDGTTTYTTKDYSSLVNGAQWLPVGDGTIVRVTGTTSNVIAAIEANPSSPANTMYRVACNIPNNGHGFEIPYNLAGMYSDVFSRPNLTMPSHSGSGTVTVYPKALLYVMTSHQVPPAVDTETWNYDIYILNAGGNNESWSINRDTITFYFKDSYTYVDSRNSTTNPGFTDYKVDFYYTPAERVVTTRLDADNYAVDAPIHMTFGSRMSVYNYQSYPIGSYSTSLGTSLIASGDNQVVIGKYNIPDSNALFIVGNGASDSSRSNAAWITSSGGYNSRNQYRLPIIAHIDAAPSSDEWANGLEWTNSSGGRAAILEYGSLKGAKTLRLTLSGTPGTTYQSGLIINKSYGNTYTGSIIYNGDNGQLTVPGVIYADSGISWKANTNIACPATANSQEWSIDLNGGSYTGTYFHVWSGKNSKSILQCFNDDNSVAIPNGPLTCGNRITASNGNTWTNGFVVRDTRMPLTHSFSAQTDSAGFFISPDLTAGNFIGRMFMREYTSNSRALVLETSRTISGSRKYNGFCVGLDSSGNATYSVSNGANFRSAIGAAASSDRRLKTNLTPLGEEAVDFINSLTAYQYDIGEDMWRRHEVGVIAQDVSAADPWHTKMAFQTEEGLDGLDDWEKMRDGSPTWKLDYVRLIPPLITTIQKLTKRIEELEKLINS